MDTFTCFPKLPPEVQDMIWKASRLDLVQLAELSIECVARPKDERTGIFKHNPNALVLQGEVDTQLQIAIQVIPDIRPPGIFQACRRSRAIATKFNAEIDKVIVIESRLDRLPRAPITPWHLLREEAFKKDLGSLKHIAAFVPRKANSLEYQGMAYSCHQDARHWFPQMETFTAITVDRIESHLWSHFTSTWAECDISRISPWPPVDLFQDKSLFYSWLAMDRRERHIKNMRVWEDKKIQEKREREKRKTRAARIKWEVARVEEETFRRECRRRYLAGFLGREWGEKEESKEWEGWVKERQREG